MADLFKVLEILIKQNPNDFRIAEALEKAKQTFPNGAEIVGGKMFHWKTSSVIEDNKIITTISYKQMPFRIIPNAGELTD